MMRVSSKYSMNMLMRFQFVPIYFCFQSKAHWPSMTNSRPWKAILHGLLLRLNSHRLSFGKFPITQHSNDSDNLRRLRRPSRVVWIGRKRNQEFALQTIDFRTVCLTVFVRLIYVKIDHRGCRWVIPSQHLLSLKFAKLEYTLCITQFKQRDWYKRNAFCIVRPGLSSMASERNHLISLSLKRCPSQ